MIRTKALSTRLIHAHAAKIDQRSRPYSSYFLKFSQAITWPFAYLFFNTFFNLKVNGRENLKRLPDPFIIISNHIGFFDSFMYRIILGFGTRHLPLRFMAVTKFNWRALNILKALGVIDFIYSLFGVFTVVPGLGIEKNLEGAKNIIYSGDNVVIYPEGKIVVGDEVGPFKKGAAALSLCTKAPVLPISFRIVKKSWLRRHVVVNIGEPIFPKWFNDAAEATDAYRESVLKLYSA